MKHTFSCLIYYFSNAFQVVTYKNHALNNFLKDCLKKASSPDVKIVRVGRLDDGADDGLRKCLLREVCLKGFILFCEFSFFNICHLHVSSGLVR